MKFRSPKIVGIVNLTEDSFSDGGLYLDPDRALEQATRLAADGAAIVELGPSASNPDSVAVSARQEIRRLEPLIDKLAARGIAIAVDSFQADTHRYCAGRSEVVLINDISGFPHPEVYDELARATCKLVVMHSVGGRAMRSPADPVAVVSGLYRFFEHRLSALDSSGIARTRMILDPGMGYFLGSNPEPSIAALREIPKLRRHFGLPVMVSVSRKSFLGTITGREISERGAATLAAELFTAMQGVDYIRTHDVAALSDGLKLIAALANDE
jgi:dihydropteroate synthase